jgi:hypothetical protein
MHMEPLILIGVLTIVPLLVIVVLRANAMLVFMSLCMGYTLANIAYYDINSLFASFSPNAGSLQLSWIKVLLVCVPIILSILFTAKSIRGSSKQFANFFLAIATSVVFGIIIKQFLPAQWQRTIETEPLWVHINALETIAFITGAVACLIMMLSAQRARAAVLKDKK